MKSTFKLVVNPIACDGHGTCSELFPEMIALDLWGFPIIDDRLVSSADEKHALRAVRACPRLALTLVRQEQRKSK